MDFELEPPDGVGPLRLGMTLDAARSALAGLGELSGPLHANRPGGGLGLAVGTGVGGRVNSVELYRPQALDVVRYRDVDVFGLPAEEVVQRLRRHARVLPDEEDEGCFIAPDLLLSLWRPFVSDDPEESQGYYFSSVLVARPGYYDTPAQAAARLAAGGTPGY
ncbi:hypothetical protein [Micromonospora sp. I033]